MSQRAFAISSGQMSGHLVNPKYMSTHCPVRSVLLTVLPSTSISVKGPPSSGLPTDFCLLSCFVYWYW